MWRVPRASSALPYADRQLVTQNLVGGDEGISQPGVSLSKLIQNSNSAVFASTERSRLTYVGRLRAYRDLTEGSNLDAGGSDAFGPSAPAPEAFAAEDMNTELIGFDAPFRYRPLRRAIYRRFQARTEFVRSRPRAAGLSAERSLGYYVLAEYQFARRWFAGARFDRSAHRYDSTLVDTGGSFFLTLQGRFRNVAS